MKQNIYTSQQNIAARKSSNVFKTWLYLTIFALVIGALGFVLSSIFNAPIFMYGMFAFAVGTNIFSYWFSDKIVLRMSGAEEIQPNSNPELFEMIRNLVIKANLPMPKVYIIQDPSPNAFATGRSPQHSAVAFTTGILALLNKEELKGVAAHELAHIANRDTLLMTVVAVMASVIQFFANFAFSLNSGDNENRNIFVTVFAFAVVLIVAPLAATLVQTAISRKREFLADSTGAEFADSPTGLAEALKKIHAFPVGMANINPSISHLYINNPEKESGHHHTPWYAKLFSTHPPLSERLQNLLG